jgi:YVTN family beta-propeller protein
MGWDNTILGGTVDFRIERYVGTAWQDTGWADRLSVIGRVSRRLGANWQGGFEAGQWTCGFADTDYNIWGSLASLLNQKLRFSVRVDGSAWDSQFTGRVVDESVKDSSFSMVLIDLFEDVKNSYFIWDYEDASLRIDAISGSNVIYTDESDFQDGFCTLGGTQGTGGEMVKFWMDSVTAPIGKKIHSLPGYLVKSATWSGGVGTLELSINPQGVGSGWYTFIRQDLIFSGNPGQIIYDILTGTNTNLQWTADDIDMNLWGSGTNSSFLFDFSGTIEGNETANPGDVLQTLKELCQSSLSDMWFNASGEFSWAAWRPRFPQTLYHYREGSQVSDLEWSSNVSDIVTESIVRYAFQITDDYKWGGEIKRNFPETVSTFNRLDRAGTLETKWIYNVDEAVVIGDRIGIYHKKGLPKVSFNSPLFGLVGTLASLIDITSRSGSLATTPFEIRSIDIDFSRAIIGFEAVDATKKYGLKGFARWEDGSVSGTGVPSDRGTSLVSGTSKSGWSWFNSDGNRVGTTKLCLDNSGGTLYYAGSLAEGDFFTIPPTKGTVSNNVGVGDAPTLIGLNESTGFTYVGNSSDDSVSVIHPTTKAVVITVGVGDNPKGLDIDENGGKVLVANSDADTVSVIHIASHTVSATISVGGGPWGVAVEDTLGKAFVTNTDDGTVSVIDLASNTVSAVISVGSDPLGIRSEETSAKTYVCNFGSDAVSVIDSTSNTVSATISVGQGPRSLDYDEGEGYAFVVCSTDSAVHVIHMASSTISAILTVGVDPREIACDETAGLTYVTSITGNAVTVIHSDSLTISYTISLAGPYGVVNYEADEQTFVAKQAADEVAIIGPETNNWELLYASTSLSPGTMVVVRGTETTYSQCMLINQPIYIAGSQMPPMEWLSGKIQGTSAGTVRNIDADLYGTVFRWF